MTTQVPPEDQSSENQLICEKLLGWEKVLMPEDNYPAFKKSWCHDPVYAPPFTNWREAGLILDALIAAGVYASVHHGESGDKWKVVLHWRSYEEMTCQFDREGPIAIRKAALAYIRSLP